MSADCLSEVASQSRISGAGQHSFQLFPSKKQISASQFFYLHQSALTMSARILGLKATDVKKTNTNKKAAQLGFIQYFMETLQISWKHHNHIPGIYYTFHCCHISEQNKAPCSMLWYRTIKQASLPGLLKYIII